MDEQRPNMSNYIGNEIGQLLLANQSDMNRRVSELSDRLARMEEKIDNFEIPALWGKARFHDKIFYMSWGAGLVVGWFAKVLIGR